MNNKMDFDDILIEWGYRVHNGQPNPKDTNHLYHLSQILYENGWPYQVVEELIQNLLEQDSEREKLMKKVIKYKDKEGNDREITVGGALKQGDKHPAYKQAKQMTDTGDKPKGDKVDEPSDFERDTDQNKDIDPDYTRDSDTSDTSELRNIDHTSTDKALTRKTTDPSEEGVGLGTNKSRAGEAATHKALRMLKEGKSYEQIEEYLMSVANQKDTYLDKDWVKAAVSATKSIEETYGIDNVDDIVWDTPSGTKLINAENHGTSSDMFIKLKDDTRVGISLKKDGRVFIRNGGLQETMNNIYDDLKKYGVSDDVIEKFKEKTDIKNYTEDLEESIVSAVDKMKDDSDVKKIIDKIKNDPEYAKSLNLSEKYVKRLDNDFFDRVSGKSGKRTKDDIKTLARIAASPDYREKNPEVYQNMRDTDIRTTQRLLESIKDSEEIESAVKEDVMKGIHIDQALGLDEDMNLDDFITVYGTTPEASQLNDKSIIEMFGGEVEQLLAEYKQNPSEELKQKIKDEIKSQIQIDYKDGAKDGVIKIKHEGPPPQEYPLFTIKSRARGIGALPTLEMAQTSFMANALKFGLDVDKWPSRQKKAFLKSLEEE
jgi:hypothetical protein